MPRAALPRLTTVLAGVAGVACAVALVGCGGGQLTAHLDAPAVEVSPDSGLVELHFVAKARTTDRIADGEVDVSVGVADTCSGGQVRVTVARSDEMRRDPAPADDVVECRANASLVIPSSAFTGCDGTCTQPFDVVFAGEGLRDAATLPVVVDAALVYENAPAPPQGDRLELQLQ